MPRRWTCAALLLAASLVGCARTQTADEAWAATEKAFETAATPVEKVAAAEAFLKRFPDTEHTASAATYAARLLRDDLGDPKAADALLASVLDGVTSETTRRTLMLRRASLLAALGDRGSLAKVIATLDDGSLRYPDRVLVLEALVGAEHWEVLLLQAGAGAAQANEATVRAEYADQRLSDETIKDIARRRQATTRAAAGLALAGLGRRVEADAAFAGAAEYGATTFLGASDTPLVRYRAQAQLLAGDATAALETLGPEALFSGEKAAATLHAAAYAKVHGSTSGYGDFLWSERQRLAPTMADFTLPDYAGAEVTFSEVRNGGVSLVTFWNPG